MHRLCQAETHYGPDQGVQATTVLVDGSWNDGEHCVHEMVMYLSRFIHGITSMNPYNHTSMLIPFVEPS